MKRHELPKVLLCAFLFGSQPLFSQLIADKALLWERTIPSARDATKCNDESLLNFHCGIRDKLLKKFIKYSKKKAHTLSVVHTSKDTELIWQNSEKNVLLSNNSYQKGDVKSIPLKQRPSIFSFTSSSDPRKEKSDSLNIKLSDQNLYEMIFFPRRATTKELNNLHSYLSIKYGISLEKGKYYSSDGKMLWDPANHQEFKFRPTGLGRDDGNELYQKQSSNTADQILTISKGEIKRTGAENTATFNDQQFVIWSDDNKDLNLETDGNFKVLKRNWEINFIGEQTPKNGYYIRIPKSILNPRSFPAVYWLFIKSLSGESRKIQGIANENYVFFNKIDFIPEKEQAESTRFTFAVSPTKAAESSSNDVSLNSPNGLDTLSLDLENIVLYPNPVKTGQNFTLRFPPMENLVVAIYDGSGRLVSLDKINAGARHYQNHLSAQSSYLVTLTQNGKTIKTFKLIVD